MLKGEWRKEADMKDEKETGKKLQKSAMEEFLEKGFMKASLRTICKNAGVTTGALYFFFEDKDDLFGSLVKEPLTRVYQVMEQHFKDEKQAMESGRLLNGEIQEDDDADFQATLEIVHELYRYRDEFRLLLEKSQGSSVEGAVDEIVRICEEHYKLLAEAMQKQLGGEQIEHNVIHWIAHAQIDVFIYAVTHIDTEEEAVRYMEHAVKYMVCGWYGMFGIMPAGWE